MIKSNKPVMGMPKSESTQRRKSLDFNNRMFDRFFEAHIATAMKAHCLRQRMMTGNIAGYFSSIKVREEACNRVIELRLASERLARYCMEFSAP